jgi:hypothetical protein
MIELLQFGCVDTAFNIYMKDHLIATIMAAIFIGSGQPKEIALAQPTVVQEQVLAQRAMSLDTRYGVKSVNDVFKDNILLTIEYMSGKVTNPSQINWDEIRKPSRYELTLNPGEVFAFHEDVLPEYKGKTIKTTHAHFDGAQGFRSDGYLYGDGVCHLASLINWVARDAGLKVVAPVNHNFAKIPEIPSEYGTAIYTAPGESSASEMQNLYVENNKDRPVHLIFDYSNNTLTVTVK